MTLDIIFSAVNRECCNFHVYKYKRQGGIKTLRLTTYRLQLEEPDAEECDFILSIKALQQAIGSLSNFHPGWLSIYLSIYLSLSLVISD